MNNSAGLGWVAAVGLLLVAAILVGGLLLTRTSSREAMPVPEGYASVLTLQLEGRALSFGPFVGYYFHPTGLDGAETVDFICRNERQFYTKDLPADALLFEGRGVLVTLAEAEQSIPRHQRINPIFFPEAPEIWLATRPEPKVMYRHFHSSHDEKGASYTGYWLRHTAKEAFIYDMGGRVGDSSPLYHEARPGEDDAFPAIIEFDHGPGFEE